MTIFPAGNRHLFPAAALAAVLTAAMLASGVAAAEAGSELRPPAPAVYRYTDLTSRYTARLNREKTLVILPVAPVQTHGPHLPIGTDLLLVDALVDEIATRLRAGSPEHSVLILPALPVGAGTANELGNIYSHPATITMDPDVLLTFLYDWILNPAESAYWNFFVVSTHTGAENMRVLGEACDFFTEVYGMNTVNVTSLVLADSIETARLSEAAARRAPGTAASAPLFELHGGLLETSMMLAVDPARVEPEFRDLAPVPVHSFQELTTSAQALGWPGYFGVPSAATAELGRDVLALLADAHAAIILDAAAGIPWQSRPTLEDALAGDFWLRETVRGSALYQKIKRDRFDAWLKARRDAEEEIRKNRASGK